MIVLVVPTDTNVLPITWLTLASIVASLKFILSLTLYPVPESITLTEVIVEDSTPFTLIFAFEFKESSSKG